MILYLRIATDIPAGTAITTRYIMDKYKVSRSTSRNALAVLAHIGAAEEISRIHTEGTAYSLSPDAADKAQRYRKLVIIMRKTRMRSGATTARSCPVRQIWQNGGLYLRITGCLWRWRQSAGR